MWHAAFIFHGGRRCRCAVGCGKMVRLLPHRPSSEILSSSRADSATCYDGRSRTKCSAEPFRTLSFFPLQAPRGEGAPRRGHRQHFWASRPWARVCARWRAQPAFRRGPRANCGTSNLRASVAIPDGERQPVRASLVFTDIREHYSLDYNNLDYADRRRWRTPVVEDEGAHCSWHELSP